MKPVKPVKRVEIVVEAVELDNLLDILERIGVGGYTLIRQVGGRGERGERRAVEFTYEVENVYLIVACDDAQANDLVTAVGPVLKRFGGMCLVSDALWVTHKT